MKQYLLSLLVLSAFLSGCATTQKMSASDRQNLESVQINSTVQTPPEMYYLAPGASAAMLFGGVGGLIAGAASESPGKSLKAFAEKNNIFIDKIVYEELYESIKKSGKLLVTDSPTQKSAILNISIVQYGFSVPTAFSSKIVPVIYIKCTLVDSSGRVIWSSSDRVLPLGNPADAVAPNEIRSNPKLIESSWRIASKAIASKIVKTL